MANDKELSSNEEVQRGKDFQDQIELKEKILDTLKELLVTSTEKVFKKLGVDKNDSHAGEYGDGTTYGAGAKENTFSVKIAGKTKSHFTKEIIYGAKTVVSVVNIVFKDKIATIDYRSPESGYFRGIDAGGKPYMVNEKINITTTDFKEFKSLVEDFLDKIAERELGYLHSTKLGVEDKTEKSTTSVVESIKHEYNMKKLTIKDLFSEGEDTEKTNDKAKKANTVDLDKTTPPVDADKDKKMFFDEDKEEETKEEKSVQKEITASGGGAGAGAFNPKNAWKKTNYGKAKIAKENKPTITKDWQVVPKGKSNSVELEATDKKSTEKDNLVPEKVENKSNGVVEPSTDKNFDLGTGNQEWKNTNQTKAPSSGKDDFWQEVKLEPGTGYIPVGMKQNFIAGMHGASNADLKKRGYAEGVESSGELLNENVKPVITNTKKPDLTSKKFFSESDNKSSGVNKRYLITEKTTQEYEQERWKKLTQFKTYESIKEAEEMNEFFEQIQNEKQDIAPVYSKKSLTENVSHDDLFNDTNIQPSTLSEAEAKETVTVEKPGSKFGLEYVFLKKDFINESMRYILDLNSRVYVPNPNFK